MDTEAQKLLGELQNDFGISRESLAAKFHVHSMTIRRWTSGETNMTFAEFKMLKDIYRREVAKRNKKNASE